MGCRPGTSPDAKGEVAGTVPTDTNDDVHDDRHTNWNEVSIDEDGRGTLVEVMFQAAYGVYGYEGWGGPHTVRDEFFYGAGYQHPLSFTTRTDDDYCTRSLIDDPSPSADLGRDLPFLVGNRERKARRTRWSEGQVDYMWEPTPLREPRLTVGDTFSVFGESGPAVPEPVQLTEPWAWEYQRTELFTEGALRIAWEPGGHPGDVVYLSFFLTSPDTPDSEGSATLISCAMDDDGGVVLTAAPANHTPRQLLYSMYLSRERFLLKHVDEIGPAALVTYASTWLETDPFPSTAMSSSQPALRRPAPHRWGAPTLTLE
jgi:hypothetical protein